MEYLIAKTCEGELVCFSPASDNPEIPETADPCRVFSTEVIPATVLNADAADVYWLYEVCFSDFTSVCVIAFDFSDALVTALLHRDLREVPLFIYEYDLFDLKERGKSAVTTYKIDDRLNRLLSVLNEENRDLVAHVIPYVNGVSEQALKRSEMEYVESKGGVGKTGLDLSADEIRKLCSYIWSNHILFEATGADTSVYSLHRKQEKPDDPLSALLWTYIFEQWAHYDCRLPYTLYRLLIDGGFDGLLDGFHAQREILE